MSNFQVIVIVCLLLSFILDLITLALISINISGDGYKYQLKDDKFEVNNKQFNKIQYEIIFYILIGKMGLLSLFALIPVDIDGILTSIAVGLFMLAGFVCGGLAISYNSVDVSEKDRLPNVVRRNKKYRTALALSIVSGIVCSFLIGIFYFNEFFLIIFDLF